MRKTALTAALLAVSLHISAQSLPQSGIPVDAQTASMASTFVAAPADGQVHWNNIAAAAFDDAKLGAALSYGIWQPELSSTKPIALSGFGHINDRVVMSGGFKNIGQTIPLFDEDGNPLGDTNGEYISVGLGTAYELLPGLVAGLTADYHSMKLGEDDKLTAIGISISGQYRLKDLTLGLKVSDLGSSNLPSMASLGASYKLALAEKHTLDLRAQAAGHLGNGSFNAGAALQYTALDMISVRAGYYLGDSEAFIPSHLSMGLGFKSKGIGLDAAYLVFPSEIGNSLCFTLKFFF